MLREKVITHRWLMDEAAKVVYLTLCPVERVKAELKHQGLNVSSLEIRVEAARGGVNVSIKPLHGLKEYEERALRMLGARFDRKRGQWLLSYKRLERTQPFHTPEALEKFLEEGFSGEEALSATALFILRQAKRAGIPKFIAGILSSKLLEIASKAEESEKAAREFLGYLRWFFEASEGVKLPEESEVDARRLIEMLSTRYRQQIG